jgi:hypothetical protein
MTNYKLTILSFIFISLILLLTSDLAEAKILIIEENNSAVINNISVESNTGGQEDINDNPAYAGQDWGESNSNVSVFTEINGEVVQDIQEQTTGGSVEIYSEVEADNEEVYIKTVIEKEGKEIINFTDSEQVLIDAEQDLVDEKQNAKQISAEKKNDLPNKKESSVFTFWQIIINKIINIFNFFNK